MSGRVFSAARAVLVVNDAPAHAKMPKKGARLAVEGTPDRSNPQRRNWHAIFDVAGHGAGLDLQLRDGTWFIMRSRVPTMVNDRDLTPFTPLHHGDRIVLGSYVLTFERQGTSAITGVEFAEPSAHWFLYAPMRDGWRYAQKIADGTIGTAFDVEPHVRFAVDVPGTPQLLKRLHAVRIVEDVAGVPLSALVGGLRGRGDTVERSIVFTWLWTQLAVARAGLLVDDSWITFDGRLLVVGVHREQRAEDWAARLLVGAARAFGAELPDRYGPSDDPFHDPQRIEARPIATPAVTAALERVLADDAAAFLRLMDHAAREHDLNVIARAVAPLIERWPYDQRFARALMADVFAREVALDRAVREEAEVLGVERLKRRAQHGTIDG